MNTPTYQIILKQLLLNLQYLFIGAAILLSGYDVFEGIRTGLVRYYIYAASRIGLAAMVGLVGLLVLDAHGVPLTWQYVVWMVSLSWVIAGVITRIWELRQQRKLNTIDARRNISNSW